jgi:F0F1-type ATP synthase epsilon subunit
VAEPKEHPADELLDVKIFSPYHTFYKGPAKSLSALNSTGPFDVLSGHINFFSVLKEGNVVVDTGNDPREIPITHGIIHVRQNQVTLFVFGLAEDEQDGAKKEKDESKPRPASTKLR